MEQAQQRELPGCALGSPSTSPVRTAPAPYESGRRTTLIAEGTKGRTATDLSLSLSAGGRKDGVRPKSLWWALVLHHYYLQCFAIAHDGTGLSPAARQLWWWDVLGR